jgi:hypothetical protein
MHASWRDNIINSYESDFLNLQRSSSNREEESKQVKEAVLAGPKS